MRRALTLVLVVGLVAACGTDEPVSQEPPALPTPPADSSPKPDTPPTTLYDTIPADERILDYLTEWTIREAEDDFTVWEKDVEGVSVRYDVTPDVQQACEQLLTSPGFLLDLPGGPEAHQTVLNVLMTQGVMESMSEWVLERSEDGSGLGAEMGGPELHCGVASDGSEEWDTHLPGIIGVLFGESNLITEHVITGKLSVEEGWKTIGWTVIYE